MFEIPRFRDPRVRIDTWRFKLKLRYITAEQEEIKKFSFDPKYDTIRKYTKVKRRPIKRQEEGRPKSGKRRESIKRAKKSKRTKLNDASEHSRTKGDDNESNETDEEDDHEELLDLELENENGRSVDSVDVENVIYIGLFSNEVYNYKGEIDVGDRRRYGFQVREYADGFESENDIEDDQLHNKTESSSVRANFKNSKVTKMFNLISSGMDILPRAAVSPKLIYDSPSTINLIRDENDDLSSSTKKLLTKKYLSGGAVTSKRYRFCSLAPRTNLDVDPFRYGNRIRKHCVIANSLLRLAIVRGDYPLAFRAFSLLLHISETDVRFLWTVGLELLVWRRELREQESYVPRKENELPTNGDVHTLQSTAEKEDETFLDWLILNFPVPREASAYGSKISASAVTFNKFRLLTKLRHGDPNSALNSLEDLILIPPYSEDPVVYALCGIAVMQLMTLRSVEFAKLEVEVVEREAKLKQLAARAHKYFEECQKYGGVLPEDFINFEITELAEGYVFEKNPRNHTEQDEEAYSNDSYGEADDEE
ncbi:hypothetical protein AWJ20_1595 [Sugiyamaella lignohabitans]|uniref:Uncharacterized protein n=1 Tax=Sugiyamaella lignohabitans TaxID=796027 RepID=A0A167DUM1_9ASCO|nr:uncharacterized protein AWJ20_1595 [Sugiyamaella lignohabitans]ANB13309.1 hypothetical protein AWJ20_1595 [Sugiyamaella lignohabitans]